MFKLPLLVIVFAGLLSCSPITGSLNFPSLFVGAADPLIVTIPPIGGYTNLPTSIPEVLVSVSGGNIEAGDPQFPAFDVPGVHYFAQNESAAGQAQGETAPWMNFVFSQPVCNVNVLFQSTSRLSPSNQTGIYDYDFGASDGEFWAIHFSRPQSLGFYPFSPNVPITSFSVLDVSDIWGFAIPNIGFTFDGADTPEPAFLLALGLVFIGLFSVRRRRVA